MTTAHELRVRFAAGDHITPEALFEALPDVSHFVKAKRRLSLTGPRPGSSLLSNNLGDPMYVPICDANRQPVLLFLERYLHSFSGAGSTVSLALTGRKDALEFEDDVMPQELLEDVIRAKQQPNRGTGASLSFGAVATLQVRVRKLAQMARTSVKQRQDEAYSLQPQPSLDRSRNVVRTDDEFEKEDVARKRSSLLKFRKSIGSMMSSPDSATVTENQRARKVSSGCILFADFVLVAFC